MQKKTRELLISIPVVAAILLTDALWVLVRHNNEVGREYASSCTARDSLRTQFDAALASIAEIQDSLATVLPGETAVLDISKDVERGGPLTRSRKDQVLHTISDLNESINRSKEMIHRLEQRLSERHVRVASLEKVISNIKSTVAEREQMIVRLAARVQSLDLQVTELQKRVQADQQQIQAQEQVIEKKRREISTVYYVLGTKEKLKQLGVVQESGGVIGIGKAPQLSGNFPEQALNNLDTDVQTTIPVPGTRPTVLSGQSTASYEIVPISADSSEIRITNPQEFRKVRYLVIRVG